ncbi:MAG: TIGR02147 family protein [Bdellovibrionales bacterium]|nr:TIGR02147 family protein [Bdellovibrionales bacterium]
MVKKNSRPDIYQYQDPTLFIQDMVVFIKSQTKAFSFRYFAKKSGFASPSALKLILDRKRGLTEQSVAKVAKGLALSVSEGEYLLALVKFINEKNSEKRKSYFEQCIALQKKKRIKTIGSEQFEYFSKWYHPAIRELIKHKNFQESPEWIASMIYPKITVRQAKDSLKLLISLGLIQRDQNGKLVQSDRAVSTDRELQSMIARQFHETMAKKAIESLHAIDPQDRDISGITFGIPSSKVQELKDKIASMRKELTSTIGSLDDETEEVYHLNIQLFPLTKKEKKK